MANGFRYSSQNVGSGTLLSRLLMAASTQFQLGDACVLADGILSPASGQTVSPTHVFNTMITPASELRPATANLSTTAGEMCLAEPCAGTNQIFESDLTGTDAPFINGTACNSNSSTTTVKVTASGSTNDAQFGTIYIPELDQQRQITADSVSGGVHTYTVASAFSQAPTTGNTARVVPWSPGMGGIKLTSNADAGSGVSTAVADKTGGHCNIAYVDLKRLVVGVMFPTVLT